LCAETGKVLHRLPGSSKKRPHLEPITFIPAQTTPFSVSNEEVNVEIDIGPKAKKPMKIAHSTDVQRNGLFSPA